MLRENLLFFSFVSPQKSSFTASPPSCRPTRSPWRVRRPAPRPRGSKSARGSPFLGGRGAAAPRPALLWGVQPLPCRPNKHQLWFANEGAGHFNTCARVFLVVRGVYLVRAVAWKSLFVFAVAPAGVVEETKHFFRHFVRAPRGGVASPRNTDRHCSSWLPVRELFCV